LTLSLSPQVACVILSDRGILSLDDPALIKQHLPELTDLEIFKGYDEDGNPMHVKRRNREITLRMLLSHTSGE
jgi:CubicO group peptidase (beta-lactamase class C family)